MICFSYAIFLALVADAADEEVSRKVPPRTPLNRMTTIMRFGTSWIDSQISLARPARASRMISSGLARLENRLILAFNRCGYFDPSVPNGGPRPSRKRRETDDEDSLDVFDLYEDDIKTRGTATIRLSEDVDMAWKQIGTGIRKWVLRYLAECPGERKTQNHTKRYIKVKTYNRK